MTRRSIVKTLVGAVAITIVAGDMTCEIVFMGESGLVSGSAVVQADGSFDTSGVTVAGMLLNARLPKLRKAAGYDPRFSNDKFGILVMGGPAQLSGAEQILRAAGAEEVRNA